MEKYSIFTCLLTCVALTSCQSGKDVPLTVPSLGRIRGLEMSTVAGNKLLSFRGIPYAEAPVGKLRFNDPVPVKTWGDNELDATREGPTCVQFDTLQNAVIGTEDCLALNVYTPSLKPKKALPVMFWMHEGAFMVGSGGFETQLYGPGYLLDRDVVLVTINYRLGPMGFLSTEDAEAPGNYGLLDQLVALKWVKDNIQHFGGDPNLVTIFGESAGAASTELHILSPRSKGLFNRAIAQSGVAACSWALQNDVGEYTRTLAKLLDCPTSSSRALLDCLRNKEAFDVVNTRRQIMQPIALGLFPLAFGPRIDSERESPFLPDHPEKLYSQKKFNAVPFMAGVTPNEGSVFAASFATADETALKEFQRDPINSIRYSLGLEKRENGDEIAKKVLDHYFGKTLTQNVIVQGYEKMTTDYGFFKCVDKSIKLMSKNNDYNTYYYYYAHKGQFSFLNILNIAFENEWGVTHGDDIFMLFNSGLFPPLTVPDDLKVSKMMVDLWTSFAAEGVPQSDIISDNWQPLRNGETRYLHIDSKNPKMINRPMPFESKLAFWDSLEDSKQSSRKDEL